MRGSRQPVLDTTGGQIRALGSVLIKYWRASSPRLRRKRMRSIVSRTCAKTSDRDAVALRQQWFTRRNSIRPKVGAAVSLQIASFSGDASRRHRRMTLSHVSAKRALHMGLALRRFQFQGQRHGSSEEITVPDRRLAQPASLNGRLFGSKRDRKIAASMGSTKQ
jgi:hypothetical protein